jgi:hypothetical protein
VSGGQLMLIAWLFGDYFEKLYPDDAAPWSWNLKADLFADDSEWSELLDSLRSHYPES